MYLSTFSPSLFSVLAISIASTIALGGPISSQGITNAIETSIKQFECPNQCFPTQEDAEAACVGLSACEVEPCPFGPGFGCDEIAEAIVCKAPVGRRTVSLVSVMDDGETFLAYPAGQVAESIVKCTNSASNARDILEGYSAQVRARNCPPTKTCSIVNNTCRCSKFEKICFSSKFFLTTIRLFNPITMQCKA